MSLIARAYLAVAVGLLAVVFVEIAVPSSLPVARGLSYARALVFMCLLGVLAFSLALKLFESRETGPGAALLWMLALLTFDPYSFGFRGGHSSIQPEFKWQSAAFALLLLLISAAAVSLRYRARRRARMLLAVEAVGFLLLNAVYFARDGFYTRSFSGEYSSPQPLLITVGGLCARLYVHLRMAADDDRVL